jgi:sulfhydrogenase subunit alpha
MQEVIGGRAVHPVNAVLGGFGKLPNEDQLIALRAGLLQAVSDCQATVDLIASLPAADFCRAETVFAALRSPGDYGYYLGDEVVVCQGRETIPAAGTGR